ncbi:MAG: hypothetical protein KKD44_17280 [Proteobacteria bacterium]|nr:hypothetical protein [Pseudomonadota bacterium]
MNAKKQLTLTVLICLVVSIASLYTYHRFWSLKIVAIDTRPYLAKIQTEFMNGDISESELDQRLLSLADVIKNQPENHVVLISEMVVSKNVKRIEP